jgi:hypothetical protein
MTGSGKSGRGHMAGELAFPTVSSAKFSSLGHINYVHSLWIKTVPFSDLMCFVLSKSFLF